MRIGGNTGNWRYYITIGGAIYDNDEISESTSVNVSAGSSGFDIAKCCTSTISGELKYKGIEGDVQKNSVITLTCVKNEGEPTEERQVYGWFIGSYSVEDNSIIHFTGKDAIAFTDNSYPMAKSVENNFAAAESVVTSLCGQQVRLPSPAYSYKDIPNGASGWSIRDLLCYAAVYNGTNYRSTYGESGFAISSVPFDIIPVAEGDYSELTIGAKGTTISLIRVARADGVDPILPEGKTFDDYKIFYIGSQSYGTAKAMRLVCPWVEADIKADAFLNGLIGMNSGTEFSCGNVKLDRIYPAYTRLSFNGYDADGSLYIGNASYKFSPMGIFASVSGSGKPLSDYQYINKTERELNKRVVMGIGYNYGMINEVNGIYWDDRDMPDTERVDNG